MLKRPCRLFTTVTQHSDCAGDVCCPQIPHAVSDSRNRAGTSLRHRRPSNSRRQRAAVDAVAAQPARARLVHLLCRRRANRFRAVRLGLSHHAALDAGRHRAGSVGGRLRLADRPNAGRRAGRCRAIGALRRRHRHRRHLHQRLDLCGAADFSDGAGGVGVARAGELRAGPGDGRDQPRPGRATPRSANGSAAMRALLRSATAWRQPRWAPAAILSRPARFSSSRCCCSVPALFALRTISGAKSIPNAPMARGRDGARIKPPIKPGELMQNRPLLIFAACLLLFHLANAAMLPLMGSVVTMRSSRWATVHHRGLHRRAAARGRGAVAVDRHARANLGPPSVAADRFCRAAASAAFCSRR